MAFNVSTPRNRETAEAKPVKAMKNARVRSFMVKGNVVDIQLLVGTYTANRVTAHATSTAMKALYLFFKVSPLQVTYSYVLSTVTSIVTVVGVSESTEFGVVVTSKSNFHVPTASRSIGLTPVSGEAKVNVQAVSPTLYVEPTTCENLTTIL